MGFVEDMKERGLVAQITHEEEFAQHCKTGRRTAYVGFDPTADSLHVGHLVPVMTLARWQKAGHRVIAVMGGGTAMIGDPTGKSEMRQMLDQKDIDHNIACFKQQVAPLIDFSTPEKGLIVNNAEWLSDLNYLQFLRQVGVHFSVNRMLTAECFRARMEKGLSFLEFNYMLLQAYDFYHLHNEFQCTVQLGGDDQWSNILAGTDLIRRKSQAQTYCLTVPLLTTTDGRKMGKTEKGAVWLDPKKTSPYEYYQYWRNIPDELVGLCLRLYTFLPLSEILELEALGGAEINAAKEKLAGECTRILHGDDQARAAEAATKSLFGGGHAASGNEPEHKIAKAVVNQGCPVVDLLAMTEFFVSKSEVRRLINQGGLALNGKKVENSDYLVTAADFDDDGGCLVKKGKKHYYRLKFSD